MCFCAHLVAEAEARQNTVSMAKATTVFLANIVFD